MPLYDVQHIVPLTDAQQDELAMAITKIHSTRFSTPKMFVNVKFTDISNTVTYIGGKRRTGNHIIANVRVGPSRTQQDWDELCLEMLKAWDGIVPMPKVKRSAPDQDHSLRSCIIVGGLTAGYEAGFLIPPAGGDVAWLHEHMEEFEAKANGGDEEFAEMVQEVKERGMLNGANGKSAQQKLEEALGWGDSA